MCGIFGVVAHYPKDASILKTLVKRSERRGKDASGLIWLHREKYYVYKSNDHLSKIWEKNLPSKISFVAGHSRLITSGEDDNQPVNFENIWVIHNGIVLNASQLWSNLNLVPKTNVDSEIIGAFFKVENELEKNLEIISDNFLAKVTGSVSACVILPEVGKGVLFSNTGSLYYGKDALGDLFFASEANSLENLNLKEIFQLDSPLVFDLDASQQIEVKNEKES